MNFKLWAPKAKSVQLLLWPDHGQEGLSLEQAQKFQLEARPGGLHVLAERDLVDGDHYALCLDGGRPLPDPRSRYQPDGVHEPSCWVDFDTFNWKTESFRPVPLASAVIYEMHVGTFTSDGTFESAIDRLDHLVELGITHVEVMPVAAFPGQRGWGYDGVGLFAPHRAYGGPWALQRFVDACHARGLAVILDVVYNHLGPSGNYLGQFGPYFSGRYHTPWGDAVNFDSPGSDQVRRLVCDNALSWLRDYRIDGLRLDAVHEIYDTSAFHILEQLSEEVDVLESQLARPMILIAESASNDPRNVRSRDRGGLGLSSQWSDDFHHALHAALTEERLGYYEDFGSVKNVAEALEHGFVYRGQYSEHRGYSFGRSSEGLQRRRFVVFSQNHDQVGNRAKGERLSHMLSPGRQKIAAALTILSPFVPLIFMGEEWGTKVPFQYFTHHAEPELAKAVSRGRKREFATFGWKSSDVPDPQDEATFQRSILNWQELEQKEHADLLAFYRALLELRSTEADLRDDRPGALEVRHDEAARWVSWRRGRVLTVCHWGASVIELELEQLSEANQGACVEAIKSSPDVVVGATALTVPPDSVAVVTLTD